MTAYLLSHPNNTLWDFFKIERKQKRAMWNHLPTSEKFKKVFRNVVDIVSDTAIETAHLMADVVEWCVHTLHHPHVGMRQVSDFFNQFGRNVMIIHGLLMNDTQRTVENVGGGTLLFIRHHPADFMSAAIVIFATGAAQIHGLFMAIEFVFGSAATAIIKVLLTVMTFMHFVDVPVLLISPFVSSFAKTSSALSSGLNLTQNGSTLTLDAIQPTNACLIPKAYQPTFSSRDLCLSTPAEVRVLLFGTAKRSIDMSDDERMHAFNYFHDFVCCFLTDQEFEVNAPVINETSFEATLVPMPVKMTDCDKLFAVHSATTAWRTSVGSGSVEED
ncbi:unnamed protein product [Hyaloperonospora brassicae]|uniref:Uncharacterized protein n=1 Tax=Hyaloperonospora brassicae TaxID=162125 RepID=A0AAV0UG64_HYABA|nr:unnamed protein product [Hyaloperonospora brassicae]